MLRRLRLPPEHCARALRSTYRTAAHSKFLRDICGDEPSLRLIADDPSGATLDEQDRAIYEFAGKVGSTPVR